MNLLAANPVESSVRSAMMDLYIMRHGIAEEVSASGEDRDRVLTDEGRRKTHESGKALRKLDVVFERVLSSPYARAWQTAEIVVEEMGIKQLLERCDALSSGAPLRGVFNELQKLQCASALIVGHEPDLSRLISVLLSGGPHLAVTMKKGSLAKLRYEKPGPGNARLEWLLAPKHLCRLG